MFSTLKNSSDPEGAYVLEPTRPPFDSKRQGKLARIACTHCRAKKLKCSGDTNGCARCLNKKMECRYPTAGNAAPAARSSPSSAASPPGNTAPPAENATTAVPDDDVDALMNLDHPSTALFLGSLDAPPAGGNFVDTAPGTIQWPFDDLFPVQDLHALQPAGGGGQITDGQPHPFSFPAAPDSVSSRVLPHQEQQRKQSCSGLDLCCCDCIKEAIQTNESVQVDLVVLTSQDSPAGQAQQCGTLCDCHNTAGLIDVLQHQKAALASCKALVACKRCRAQSAYVMFAISMCGALLESIEHLHMLVSPSDDPAPPPAKAQRRSTSSKMSPAHSRKSSLAHASLAGSEDSSDGTPFARQQHRRGVQIGRWKLDDDDERHVIQGLLSARMVTLGRVIDGIERAVDDNQWLAHENAVRRLREPFSLASLRIKQHSSSTESLELR